MMILPSRNPQSSSARPTKEEAEEHQKNQGYLCGFYKLNDQGQEVWRRGGSFSQTKGNHRNRYHRKLPAVWQHPYRGWRRRHSGGRNRTSKSRELEQYPCSYDITYQKSLDAPPAKVYCGVEGVIDKIFPPAAGHFFTRTRHRRGEELEVVFVILTDVDGVKLNYQQPNQEDVRSLNLEETRGFNSQVFSQAEAWGPKSKPLSISSKPAVSRPSSPTSGS